MSYDHNSLLEAQTEDHGPVSSDSKTLHEVSPSTTRSEENDGVSVLFFRMEDLGMFSLTKAFIVTK
jgi:hypothetical protein